MGLDSDYEALERYKSTLCHLLLLIEESLDELQDLGSILVVLKAFANLIELNLQQTTEIVQAAVDQELFASLVGHEVLNLLQRVHHVLLDELALVCSGGLDPHSHGLIAASLKVALVRLRDVLSTGTSKQGLHHLLEERRKAVGVFLLVLIEACGRYPLQSQDSLLGHHRHVIDQLKEAWYDLLSEALVVIEVNMVLG